MYNFTGLALYFSHKNYCSTKFPNFAAGSHWHINCMSDILFVLLELRG